MSSSSDFVATGIISNPPIYSKKKLWLLAARPKTLSAGVIPVLVGTAVAYAFHHEVRLDLSLFALISTIFIQVGTNIINDALDFKKGADTAERIGPRRVTQSGDFSFQQVLMGGLICFGIASLFGVPLIFAGGWPIVWIGLFSLIAGYCYTGGPYPLAYRGLGELFVLIFFGWVAVGGMYFLNSGRLDIPAVVAGTQVGLLCTIMMAINNLRDYKTDLKADKRTLAVRLGPELSKLEVAFLCFVPFLIGIYWVTKGFGYAFFLPFLSLPQAIRLVLKVFTTEPSPVYNQFLAKGSLLFLSFGVLLCLGLML